MPTKRTWRERQGVAFPSAYQASELLTGEISYPVLGYDGYGDGVGKDLTALITESDAGGLGRAPRCVAAVLDQRRVFLPAPEYQALVVLPRRARDAAVGLVVA